MAILFAGCNEGATFEVAPCEADDDSSGKADSDEGQKAALKLTIDPAHITRARSRLSLLNDKSQRRDIWFYDTTGLALYETGTILRARKIDGDDDDSTIKLRPFTLAQLDSKFRGLDDLKCELDRSGSHTTESCSLKATQDSGEIDDVADGVRSIETLFSSDQETMLAAHGPSIGWDELVGLGPIPARVWTIRTDGSGKDHRRAVVPARRRAGTRVLDQGTGR